MRDNINKDILSIDDRYIELRECLDRLIRVYRLLLDCVRREKELLVEVKIDELTENNRSKDGALRKLRRLEHERIHIVRLMAEQLKLNVKEDPVRLLDIAICFQDDRGEALRQKHSVLDLLVKRVIDLNRENELLAKSALNGVTGALNIIRDTVEEKPTYARKGELKGQGVSGKLVRREV